MRASSRLVSRNKLPVIQPPVCYPLKRIGRFSGPERNSHHHPLKHFPWLASADRGFLLIFQIFSPGRRQLSTQQILRGPANYACSLVPAIGFFSGKTRITSLSCSAAATREARRKTSNRQKLIGWGI